MDGGVAESQPQWVILGGQQERRRHSSHRVGHASGAWRPETDKEPGHHKKKKITKKIRVVAHPGQESQTRPDQTFGRITAGAFRSTGVEERSPPSFPFVCLRNRVCTTWRERERRIGSGDRTKGAREGALGGPSTGAPRGPSNTPGQ